MCCARVPVSSVSGACDRGAVLDMLCMSVLLAGRGVILTSFELTGVGELLEFFRRVRVLQELVGRQHGDAIPRADLVAERAADAAGEVDRADLERLLVTRAGDRADAIDRADRHARLAAGAHVFVKQRERFR